VITLIDAILPKNKDYARFQVQVYRRIKKYQKEKNVKTVLLDYTPYLKKQDSGFLRPDVVWDIPRDVKELYFPSVTLKKNWKKIFNDGAISDLFDGLIQESRGIVTRLIFDATIHDYKDEDKWKEKIDKMEKYADLSIKNYNIDFAIPILVSDKGFDGSLSYAVERNVHLIDFHYMEEFLNDILRLTLHYNLSKALTEYLFAKRNSCDNCESDDLCYIPIYGCQEYGYLTDSVLEEWNNIEQEDGKLIQEIVLCDGCSYQGMCEGFDRTFSVVCSKCGKIKSGGKLHPCALVKLQDCFDECSGCSDPNDCKIYKDLIEKKILK
jgi:hypothetical protein